MRTLFVLCLVLALASASLAMFLCPKDICTKTKCSTDLTETSCLTRGEAGRFTFHANGGFCGCCPVCIKNLYEGEDCFQELIMDRPATEICAPTLKCDMETHKCVKKMIV